MYVKFVSYVGFKCILLHFHSLFTSANPVSIMNVNNCSNQITVTAAIDPDWLHSFLGLLLMNQIKLLFQLFHNITCTLFQEAVQFSSVTCTRPISPNWKSFSYYMYSLNIYRHIFETFKKKNRLEPKQEKKSPRMITLS